MIKTNIKEDWEIISNRIYKDISINYVSRNEKKRIIHYSNT